MVKVLFIDDDLDAHRLLKMVLPDNIKVHSSLTGKRAQPLIDEIVPDLILLDIHLTDVDGLDLLKTIVADPGSPPVLMLSAENEVKKVVQALRIGAVNYLVKPYGVEDLKNAIIEALQYKIPSIPPSEEGGKDLESFIGVSGKMKEIKDLLLTYAPSDNPVLLFGESGTGKEIAARLIHSLSPRAKGPFIPINCGAIPATLLETELFGSEKGAFTGAVTREGSFERASGGTLFLDEIGEMPKQQQVTLLRVLEQQMVKRVGGSKMMPIDVRIVSATNRNLKEAVEMGAFREDLYYRLHTLLISLPPLRDRKEDIPLLAYFFIQKQREKGVKISPGAMEKLKSHNWRGNVRELENIIQRAVLLKRKRTIIQPQDILF
jgi:two-component system, NtrC family, response regulator AtoC